MLTADLVKVRRRAGLLHPLWLKARAAEECLPLAEALVELFSQAVGMTVAQLDQGVAALIDDTTDRVRAAGLVKLLKDRCEVDEANAAEAEAARLLVFLHAATQRRALGLLDTLDRSAVIAHCAEKAGSTPEQIEATLFSDLPAAQIIRVFKPISATGLLQRYNLALAQGVLLRATRVEISLPPAPAARFREIFRMIKFCRLMHQVSGSASEGYALTLDGPMSLFESTQRYGVQLAMLLPTIVAGEGWSLKASLVWGRERERLGFELSSRDGLVSTRDAAGELEEVVSLQRIFSRLETDWTVRQEANVFDIQGKGVFVPDLVFEHKTTGARVYLEVFGYWSREAVFKRLELLDLDFPGKVILAVSRKLRVSEQAADDTFPGRILVYSQSISAHAVKQALGEM